MYPWCNATKNYIKGRCSHNCSYCYVKDIMKRFRKKQPEPYLDEKEFKENLGKDKIIFVGSSIDMFAVNIPSLWIERVLEHCRKFDNTYLFQTKNPKRFSEFIFPKKTILGISLESNCDYKLTKAPTPRRRVVDFYEVPALRKILNLEPLCDFDLDVMVSWIKQIKPEFVSIGGDSKNKGLQEPPAWKVNKLIEELKKFTSVRIKDNLKRLM